MEEEYFKIALKNVNLLYFACPRPCALRSGLQPPILVPLQDVLGCRMFDGTTLVGFWGSTFSAARFAAWRSQECDDERFLKKCPCSRAVTEAPEKEMERNGTPHRSWMFFFGGVICAGECRCVNNFPRRVSLCNSCLSMSCVPCASASVFVVFSFVVGVACF